MLYRSAAWKCGLAGISLLFATTVAGAQSPVTQKSLFGAGLGTCAASPITSHTVEHRSTGFLGENQCPDLRLALHL